AAAERIRFSSAILPRWARRTRSLDALLPILHLRGVSMGDFQEALAALLGKDAPNLSPPVIARLRNEWEADYEHWQRRDLSARRYVYLWADGVLVQARMEPQAECMLVLIGPTPDLGGAGSRDGEHGNGDICREVWSQIRQGRHLLDQGPRQAADLLRLPGRALGSPAHIKPDRERVRHGPPPNPPHQGRAVA